MNRLAIPGFAALAMIAIYAVATRAIAFFQPYHQDEYKWALAADPGSHIAADTIPHPFLGKFIYYLGGQVFGYGHLRIVPIILSIAFLALLFIYVRRRYSLRAALFASRAREK